MIFDIFFSNILCIGYMWIYRQVIICHNFRLLIWTKFFGNGHFIHPVRGGGDGVKVVDGGIVILASITLSEYIKIWCNIQVIIYLFKQ